MNSNRSFNVSSNNYQVHLVTLKNLMLLIVLLTDQKLLDPSWMLGRNELKYDSQRLQGNLIYWYHHLFLSLIPSAKHNVTSFELTQLQIGHHPLYNCDRFWMSQKLWQLKRFTRCPWRHPIPVSIRINKHIITTSPDISFPIQWKPENLQIQFVS